MGASAIFIDSADIISGEIVVDRDITTAHGLTHVGMISLNSTKASNTADGDTTSLTGISSVVTDTGSSVGTVNLTNLDLTSNITNLSGSGTTSLIGISNTITGQSNNTIGYYSNTSDGGGTDIKMVSSVDTGDYSTIKTGNHGATTITTVDDNAAAAHFTVVADGNVDVDGLTITLDAATAIELEQDTTVTGDFTVNGDSVTFESANADDPIVTIKNTSNAANDMASLKFVKDRGAAPAIGDNLAEIYFVGEDADQNTQEYGRILCETDVVTGGQESGVLKFGVANHDGGNGYGLIMTGGSADNEVDVTVGLGASSVTTVTGTLTTGSTAALDNSGVIQVASQANITTLAGLTSLGAAGATTDIAAGDLTMYNAVNDGNPTISLGSSATNRLEIESVYNSSAQTLCDINFTTYTSSGTAHDGRFNFYVDEVHKLILNDTTLWTDNMVQSIGAGRLYLSNTTTSSATEGGRIQLLADDGAAMGDDHRLGVIQFYGAEDGSSTLSIGASIQAVARDAWDGSNNDADLEFYTTDGTTESKVLTLDADKLATFAGAVNIQGSRSFTNTMGTDGQHDGDVVYFGGTTSMTVGKIYHYKSDGTWEIANADAVATSDGLLGVALGAASNTNGMLLRGMVTLDHDPGAIGDVLYVQSDNAGTPGNATATAPSASGDCVRIIGYQVNHASSGNIWFNPDSTFVEVA